LISTTLNSWKNIKNKTINPDGVKSEARGRAISRLLDLAELLESSGIGPERIINSSPERFEAFLFERKNKRDHEA
jgi:hypothetical protein